MTTEELNALIELIRYQAHTWLGDQACEMLERLFAYTLKLHAERQK